MFSIKSAMSLKRSFSAILSAGLLLALGRSAFGQQDFPNLQGNQERTGHVLNPLTNNPGRALLQWFVGPNVADGHGTITVDDAGTGVDGTGAVFGTAGAVSGSWLTPTSLDTAAANPYIPNAANPAYHYTSCVPATSSTDPTAGATADYRFTPLPANLGFNENYALYVWLPIGPMQTGTGVKYPQRYFVYQVHFGQNQVVTETVDTYAAGFGWVRLGNGGLATNAVFNYTGIYPITVDLLNTIPLNSDGSYTSGTKSTASSYLVYADAVQAIPDPGIYTATPTSSYVRDTAGNPIVDTLFGDRDATPLPGITNSSYSYDAFITSILNQSQGSFSGGTYQTTSNAVVRNYVMNPEKWKVPPTNGLANGIPSAQWAWTPTAAGITGYSVTPGVPTAGWTSSTLNKHQGANYYKEKVTAPLTFVSPGVQTPGFASDTTNSYQGRNYWVAPLSTTGTDFVDYRPVMTAGSYLIYTYIPGNIASESYGTAVQYQILQNGVVVYTGTVNETTNQGYVALGVGPFNHNVSGSGALEVHFTNIGSALDVSNKLLAYANQVEFVSTVPGDTVDYKPAIPAAAYAIYTYMPGSITGEKYGSSVTYQILQGGTIVYTGTLNENIGGGWVQLTSTAWDDNQNGAGQLEVRLTNLGSSADAVAGTYAYANSVKFVPSTTTYTINSSPVHAQVNIKHSNGLTFLTQVVIVADENGRIHCLDELGNTDGTTTEYWSYPSTPDTTNSAYQDPNLANGIDGPATSSVPVAVMPTQFSLATAVVVPGFGGTLNKNARLYISSINGRVYCLDMTGRGDYTVTTLHPGSTPRIWSYPTDYPETTQPSTLGEIRGSLVYGDQTTDGLTHNTIFVPAPSGRIIALDAIGTSTATQKHTSVLWAYPALASATPLPPIEMTPTLAFSSIYFGTMTDANSGAAGKVVSVNANTGAFQWFFDGIHNGTGSATPNTVTEAVSDFVSGPAVASAAQLSESGFSGYTVIPSDSLYFLNNNGYLYGFNPHTGQLLADNTSQGYTYHATAPGLIGNQNLGITNIQTYDRLGNYRLMPLVMAPTTDGQLLGMFANIDDYAQFSQPASSGNLILELYGWGYGLYGTNLTSAAFSNSRMVTADSGGYMYVWDNDSANYGLENAGVPPPGATVPPDYPSPAADAFRYPYIRFITKAGNVALNTVTALNQNATTTDTYNLVNGTPPKDTGGVIPASVGKYDVTHLASAVTGQAFELGQTAYMEIYHFPYQPAGVANGEIVNVRLSQNGKTIRQLVGQVHQFTNPTSAPTVTGVQNWYYDGYAVVSFTFSDGGGNALPAGPGQIQVDVTTSAVSSNTPQEIVADPSVADLLYQVANPFAFAVVDPTNNAFDTFAVTNLTNDPEAIVNGTPNVTSASAQTTSQFMQSLGFALDGQAQTVTMNVYDRSDMALLRPPGQGIANVRMDRSDLAWQGGAATVYNALNPTWYPNFEDLPQYFPNISLDYPNISRDRVGFTINSNQGIYNPLLTTAMLNPPLSASTGLPLTYNDPHPEDRVLVPTPTQITIQVPQYQPGVNMNGFPSGKFGTAVDNQDDMLDVRHNENGKVLPQGNLGVIHLFLDNGNSSIPGQFSDADSYRQFYVALGVMPDWNLQVTTPTVDLGHLAMGTGYDPLSPYTSTNNTFSPLTGNWKGAYQTFHVENAGNINDLDVHIAKGTEVDTGGFLQPWGFSAAGNDVNSWLDGSLDLWSNVDRRFAIPNPHHGGNNDQILQKARVTSGVPTQLVINPIPLTNPNLPGADGVTPLNPAFTAKLDPMVGVSIPFGFPVGAYTTGLRVIDDSAIFPLWPNQVGLGTALNGVDQVWETLKGENTVEPFTDPPLTLTFTSTETQVTNSSSNYSAPMSDTYVATHTVNGVPPTFAPTYSSPTAIRDSFGSMVAAWSSNINYFNSNPITPPTNDLGRSIFVWSVANSSTFGNGITVNSTDPITGAAPSSPLRDLDFFLPDTANNRWFTDRTPGGYPSKSILPEAPIDNNGTLVSGTESYDSPSFPVAGSKDPTTGSDLGFEYMAFVGQGQKSSGSGRTQESHVFMTEVKSGANGAVTMDAANGAPWNTSFNSAGTAIEDPTTTKGKPTVIQTSTGAIVFYGATSGSNSSIHYSRFTPSGNTAGFGPSIDLNFGTGFDSVSEPKAMVRPYEGASTSYTPNLVALTFTGKLRGRPNADIYMGQMRLSKPTSDTSHWQVVDANNVSIESTGASTPFAYFAQQTSELLVAQGSGTFAAKGVQWNRNTPIALYQYLNGNATDLLIESTRTSDPQTGIISYSSTIGGTVYLDPEVGTVRFSQAVPSPNAEVRLSYSPGFLRVTAGGASAYSDPTTIFENNYSSDNTEWFSPNGTPLTQIGNPQDGRFVFMYGKAAGGAGQTARPYLSTMRIGIRLPTRIAVGTGGVPVGLSISPNPTGPYQLDPANGRVYLTAADEDRTFTVNYTGVDEASGNPVAETVAQVPASFVLEQQESPVPIDQAVNETNLSAFLDPFSFPSSGNQNNLRPALFWLFYTSTRGGVPDVYFQTLAPRFAPVLK